ncbi:CAP domain-containing protein [Pseudolysinimonas yzui]|uniref:SCP domain-containing protein n=1 Tax=Pseudolysinimonas yzui TaxID=2708254 RepID=A0A8J3GQ14_9MICO|nr:CAP domain-containing protein [Pseudolysinimonas yzui]GHF14016.1 hypothetical protein GCM10011600_13680 [Pseudolysinimonas yzui]
MTSRSLSSAPARARFIALASATILASAAGLVAAAAHLAPPTGPLSAASDTSIETAALASATTTPTVEQMTQRVVADTNAVRAERGLPALVRHPDLDRVAADWAHQQWVNGAMSHNPSYAQQIPPGWERAGENVGKGYTYTQIVPAWVASSSHYANLVHDYTSIGVGYFEQDGRRYWSQVFAKYPGVQPPAQSAPVTSPSPAPTATAAPAPAPTSPPPSTVTVNPAPEPARPAGVALALSSPSFESGLGTWSAPSGTVDGPNTLARGGTRSLLVPGAYGRTITQSLAAEVAKGSTHTATVWIRSDGSASGIVRLRATGGVAEVASVYFTAGSSGWLRVPVALTARAAHTGLTIEIVLRTSGRTYRIDSASLVRTGEPAPAAAPAPAPTTSTTAPAPAPSPTTAPAPAPSPTPTPTPTPLLNLGGLLGGGG